MGEVSLHEKSGLVKYSVVKDVQGLISLAQISAVEIHAWGSRIDNLVNVQKRLQSLRKDLWTGIKDVRQNLAQPMKKLLSLKRS